MTCSKEYATYLEVTFKEGKIDQLNGKKLNTEGVYNVLSFVGKDAGLDLESLLAKVKSFGMDNGCKKFKLLEGSVTPL